MAAGELGLDIYDMRGQVGMGSKSDRERFDVDYLFLQDETGAVQTAAMLRTARRLMGGEVFA